MGDPAVEEGRRWCELWIHHEAEELRVHHRATIAPDEARAVVTALLASGRVPPLQPLLLGIQVPGARPVLERFWGMVRQHQARVYLILFINDRCLVCPVAMSVPSRDRGSERNRGREDQTSGGQQ